MLPDTVLEAFQTGVNSFYSECFLSGHKYLFNIIVRALHSPTASYQVYIQKILSSLCPFFLVQNLYAVFLIRTLVTLVRSLPSLSPRMVR